MKYEYDSTLLAAYVSAFKFKICLFGPSYRNWLRILFGWMKNGNVKDLKRELTHDWFNKNMQAGHQKAHAKLENKTIFPLLLILKA